MKIDVKAIAEEQNWFVAHHWTDGLELGLFGVPIGPVMAYNLLQVMGNQWLSHWEEAAEHSRAQAEAAKAAQAAAAEASRKALDAGSGALAEPNPPQAPSSPASEPLDPATLALEVSDGA